MRLSFSWSWPSQLFQQPVGQLLPGLSSCDAEFQVSPIFFSYLELANQRVHSLDGRDGEGYVSNNGKWHGKTDLNYASPVFDNGFLDNAPVTPAPEFMNSDRSSDGPLPFPIVSDDVFAQIFERSPDAMTLSTLADGRFIAVNQRFLELSEYPREELIGSRSTDLNFWPNPANREQQRRKIQRQHSLYNEEGGFRTKSGTLKIVTVSAEIIIVDHCPCVLCSIRDITQEKQAEAQLKLANERDRLLGQIALNIRQSLDLDQILHSTVAEVRQFLAVERVFIAQFDQQKNGSVSAEAVVPSYPSLAGETVGREVYDELVEIFSHAPIRIIDDIHDMKQSQCFQRLVTQYHVKAGLAVPIIVNGSLFGVLVAHQCGSSRPWNEFEQQLLQRLATQVAIAIQQSELYYQIQRLNANLEQQVTDRTRELEQRTHELADRTYELEQRTKELEELGRFRDFLLHAVTHDLRTTAVGMTMLLQSLECQTGDPIQLPRRLLSNMIQAGNKQRDKLNAIQEVHTLEIQGIPLNITPLNCHIIVDTVIALLQPRAHQNNAVLVNQVPAELPLLLGDTLQLERVFQHLITNAIAHNPPGLTITIEAEMTSGTGQTIGSTPNTTPSVTFRVIDNGQGIVPEQRDRLFLLCSDCSQVRQLGGIRLGLYLCRQIITAHDGTIGVDSVPQQGTTVWFTLPYQP